MPIIEKNGARVRVVLGTCNRVKSSQSPSTPLTILDGNLDQNSQFDFKINAKTGAWIYAVSGKTELEIESTTITLQKGTSVSLESEVPNLNVKLKSSNEKSHFAVLSGNPINESFYQH